jgi:hypothetical protein
LARVPCHFITLILHPWNVGGAIPFQLMVRRNSPVSLPPDEKAI